MRCSPFSRYKIRTPHPPLSWSPFSHWRRLTKKPKPHVVVWCSRRALPLLYDNNFWRLGGSLGAKRKLQYCQNTQKCVEKSVKNLYVVENFAFCQLVWVKVGLWYRAGIVGGKYLKITSKICAKETQHFWRNFYVSVDILQKNSLDFYFVQTM